MALASRISWNVSLVILIGQLMLISFGFGRGENDNGKTEVAIDVGKSFTLDCSLVTLPSDVEMSVKWFFGDEMINKTASRYTFVNKTMKVDSAKDDDAGVYTCAIEGAANNFTFFVSSKPRIIESSGKSMNQVQGDTLTLKCVVAGSPTPKITWFKDEKLIDNETETRFSFKENEKDSLYNLVISDLVDEDRALYTCVAENDAGSVNATTLVRVKDKLAALWPFLGIVAEVGVLCTIIFIYEKRRTKQEFEESDTDQSPDTKNVSDNKEKEVRQRK